MREILIYLKRGFVLGIGLAAGVLATMLAAVTVSGTVTTFIPGQTVSALQINENFASLKTAVESIHSDALRLDVVLAPIGSIMAWHKDFPGSPGIPSGWVECNGQMLNDSASPYHTQTIPDLNNTFRFVYGNSTSGGTSNFGGHTHGVNGTTGAGSPHLHVINALAAGGFQNSSNESAHTHPVNITSGAGGVMSGLNVVWIMRVK